jgi:hypothetical protein
MVPPRALGVLLTAVAVVAAACGGGDKPAARPEQLVSPAAGGKHDRFTVAVTGHHATGVLGKTRRMYLVEAHAVRPAVACVNNRDRAMPERPAGSRMHAVLDPARGKGGPEGWCPGAFRGTVKYSEAFACPAQGSCHPPRDFPTRVRTVARFSFSVR